MMMSGQAWGLAALAVAEEHGVSHANRAWTRTRSCVHKVIRCQQPRTRAPPLTTSCEDCSLMHQQGMQPRAASHRLMNGIARTPERWHQGNGLGLSQNMQHVTCPPCRDGLLLGSFLLQLMLHQRVGQDALLSVLQQLVQAALQLAHSCQAGFQPLHHLHLRNRGLSAVQVGDESAQTPCCRAGQGRGSILIDRRWRWAWLVCAFSNAPAEDVRLSWRCASVHAGTVTAGRDEGAALPEVDGFG